MIPKEIPICISTNSSVSVQMVLVRCTIHPGLVHGVYVHVCISMRIHCCYTLSMRQIDKELASGEYFLKEQERQARRRERKEVIAPHTHNVLHQSRLMVA